MAEVGNVALSYLEAEKARLVGRENVALSSPEAKKDRQVGR